MTSPGNHDIISKIQLRQLVHSYLKNNRAKFHPDPIWNDGALGSSYPNDNKNNKMSSNKSVPDPNTVSLTCSFTVMFMHLSSANILLHYGLTELNLWQSLTAQPFGITHTYTDRHSYMHKSIIIQDTSTTIYPLTDYTETTCERCYETLSETVCNEYIHSWWDMWLKKNAINDKSLTNCTR